MLPARERQRQALNLRSSGATYDVIADTLGYSHRSAAQKAVRAALKLTLKEPADALRQLEAARLDDALAAIWPRVQAGNDAAVLSLIRIMARRAALLGLDAPRRQEITGELALRPYTELAAAKYGLNPGEVLAEAERILAELGEG